MRVFALGLWGALYVLTAHEASARCAESAAYQARFEIVSCQEPDSGNGAILEVSVVSKKRTGDSHTYDWWPVDDPLPRKMRAFLETNRKAPCAELVPGTKRRGTMRSLCCDGGEPRCDQDVSIAIYDLEN